MCRQFGLAPPERRIGLAAHDFAQAFSAPEVVMTRAQRVDGVPTVPSRWLNKLGTILTGSGVGEFTLRIRYSPYLRVMHGTACLSTAPGGWTHVRAMVHGTVTLGTGLPGPWRRARPDDCDR